ncbi:MAG: hypothetical protein ACYC5H_13845 [Methylovirgula sp.]
MAEYYPLLAKAVAGLPNSTPEIRRAVYERARKALLAQLLSLDPPLAEADIARETEALDGAVARLEGELAALNGHADEKPQAAAPAVPTPSAPERAPPPPVSAGSHTITPPRRPAVASPQAVSPPAPKFSGQTPPGPMPLPASAPAKRPNPPEFAGGNTGQPQEIRSPRMPERPPQKTKMPLPPVPATDAHEGLRAESPASLEDASFDDLQKTRPEGLRVYAPQREPEENRGSGFRLWIVGGIVAVVVAIVAVAAWTLRDRPDRLAHLKPPVLIKPEKTGKLVERIGAGPKQQETAAAPPSHSTQAVAPAPTSAPATAPAAAANPAAAAAPAATEAAGQTIPVAQRAALLVEAPDAPNKVKTYVGTVVWRLDNVSGGAGQPLGTAVHADIDVPADKLKAVLTFQKNMDASLPASHTITVVFTVQPSSPTGGVKQISVPQLRLDDAPTGDSLIGVPVPIMENSFLIGLSRGGAEATNLDLIKQRAWFDIPMLLGNGRIAKLTFEKGTSGTRAVDDAINAWKTQ